jgi:aspartate 1-decarboxylase
MMMHSDPVPIQESAIFLKLLKSKVHQAVVTQTDLNYHGSITIDSDLLKATGLLPNEQVLVADCENGNRFETYVIPGPAGSGVIGINGAAARLSAVGNRVIVMAFISASPEEVEKHVAKIIVCDRANKITERIEQKSSLK